MSAIKPKKSRRIKQYARPVATQRAPKHARDSAHSVLTPAELALLTMFNSAQPAARDQFGSTSVDVGNDTELKTRYSVYPEIDIGAEDADWTSLAFPMDPVFQNAGATDIGNNFLRPVSCRLWALPLSVVDGSSLSDTVAVFSGCRLSNSANVMTFGQRSTVVIPMATPRWIKVGEWDYHKLMNQTFGRAVVTVENSTDKQFFEGFVCKAVGLATSSKLRLRVEYTAVQTVPTIVKAPLSIATVADTGTFPDNGAIKQTLALYKPLAVTNRT